MARGGPREILHFVQDDRLGERMRSGKHSRAGIYRERRAHYQEEICNYLTVPHPRSPSERVLSLRGEVLGNGILRFAQE